MQTKLVQNYNFLHKYGRDEVSLHFVTKGTVSDYGYERDVRNAGRCKTQPRRGSHVDYCHTSIRRSNLRISALSISCILFVAPRTTTRWLGFRALNCSSSSARSRRNPWSLPSLPLLTPRESTCAVRTSTTWILFEFLCDMYACTFLSMICAFYVCFVYVYMCTCVCLSWCPMAYATHVHFTLYVHLHTNEDAHKVKRHLAAIIDTSFPKHNSYLHDMWWQVCARGMRHKL